MAPNRVCTLRLSTALAVLFLAAPACFIFNRENKAAPSLPPEIKVPEGEVALSVTNHNFLDVVIYVMLDGVQTRVGMDTGASSTEFFQFPVLLSHGQSK